LFNFNKKNHQFPLKDQLGRFFIMGLVVFLFILFFQPFPLEQLKSENRLLYVTGLGAITFLLGFLLLGILPGKRSFTEEPNDSLLFYNLIFLILNVTAAGFYIRYVGNTSITFYIMFKVLLICILPVIYYLMLIKNKQAEQVIKVLKQQNKYFSNKLNDYKSGEGEALEIISNNKSDDLKLNVSELIFVQSADNYIEVFYKINQTIQKKLLRNTLKDVEIQLSLYTDFIRCHRTSIVNKKHIKNLVLRSGNYILLLKETEDEVPVSRQYIPTIKAFLSGKEEP